MWTREDLLASLRDVGLLRNPDVEQAVRDVDQAAFLPEGFACLAYADMPMPVHGDLRGPTMPSARCLVAALELLEPAPGLRILVDGARGGYPAALLARIVGADRVTVVEPQADLRDVTADRLARAGFADVRVVEVPPAGTFDRVLVLDPAVPRPRDLVGCLADLGFLLARGRGMEDLAFVKVVRQGDASMRMTFSQAPAPALAGGPRADSMAPVDFSRLFAVEDLLVHAWEGRILGHYDQHFEDVADETFAGGPLDPECFDPARECEKLAARRAFRAAYILQSAGELERAADAYARSLALAPSAEAHTFLGWTWSFLGRYDAAIEACKSAIEVDSTFGNPYNDIGAYLIELGRLDEAIPWLEKALHAPRYCCYFYAYTNLARVYLQQGLAEKARKALRAALKVNPEYEPAAELLRRMEGSRDYFG